MKLRQNEKKKEKNKKIRKLWGTTKRKYKMTAIVMISKKV